MSLMYHDGLSEGALEERERIVAWLRKECELNTAAAAREQSFAQPYKAAMFASLGNSCRILANRIEAGEHEDV